MFVNAMVENVSRRADAYVLHRGRAAARVDMEIELAQGLALVAH